MIMTHPKGLLVTTAAEARKASRLRLQAFGRVEGTLLSEGKPKTGVHVSIVTNPQGRTVFGLHDASGQEPANSS